MTKYIDADVLMEYLQGTKQQAETDNKTKFDALESTIDAINSTIMMKTDEIMRIVENMPTADVEPVRHGEWLDFYGNSISAECSLCGHQFEVIWDDASNIGAAMRKSEFREFKKCYHYCPNCGAKMDRGSEYDHEGA